MTRDSVGDDGPITTEAESAEMLMNIYGYVPWWWLRVSVAWRRLAR